MLGEVPSKDPDVTNRAVKRLHDARRAAGVCIYDPRCTTLKRRNPRPEHGPPFKAGRCFECYQKMLESMRKPKRRRKARRRGTR